MEYLLVLGAVLFLAGFIGSFFWTPLKEARNWLFGGMLAAVVIILLKFQEPKVDREVIKQLEKNQDNYVKNLQDKDPKNVAKRGADLLKRLRK